ncbi:hypothetical protein, partial [Klebsiella pneumoniae]|uniref:hypothetical protein n=1 Tax=Klebsiella pneumoniae TaxID=573 RepID=UPI0013308AC4
FAPLGKGLEALRAAVECHAQPQGSTAAAGSESIIAKQLGEALKDLREDVTKAVTASQTAGMIGKVESLSHEMEMIHSTLATLKDAV